MIFERLYGDLLGDSPRRRVLDIGGGLTCFTRFLAQKHDYELIDLLAHDGGAAGSLAPESAGRGVVHAMDWRDFTPSATYDLIIANDLFPNVDQRFSLFLDQFLPHANEVRLSLTYYPEPRYYLTRRLEGEEILCMLAWDGQATARVIEKHLGRIEDVDLSLLHQDNVSVYPNGRQVCLVSLSGSGNRS